MGVYITDESWLNVIDYKFSYYYLALIAFTSLGLSFCFTTYLWTSKPFASNRKKTIRLRMAQVNAMWIVYGILAFLFRLFWSFAGVEITIVDHFKYAAFMLPFVIYLYCWNLISDVYKSKNTFLRTTLSIIIIGIVLSGI
ncbi:MAG: hypothetical protein KBT58_08560 [Bizionia sp.]|nr:hypothetical protein [Bizionia sp.]